MIDTFISSTLSNLLSYILQINKLREFLDATERMVGFHHVDSVQKMQGIPFIIKLNDNIIIV